MKEFFGWGGIIELPALRSFDPRTGHVITRRWKGSEQALEPLRIQLQEQGHRTRTEPGDVKGHIILLADFGAEDTQPLDVPLADQFSLIGNDLQKSLWALPVVKAQMKKITDPTTRARVRSLVRDMLNGDPAVDPETGQETTIDLPYIMNVMAGYPVDGQVFSDLISALASGEEGYSVSQYVLRRETVILRGSTIKPSTANISKVFESTDLLKTKESFPDLPFDLPTGMWLKRTPTFVQTAADKYQITQEWWEASDYDHFIYDRVI